MNVVCIRCGRESEALKQAPIPTALGGEIHQKICASCWREWLGFQVMLINEYRLNLMDPEARKVLETQMRSFLKLAPDRPE